MRLWELPGAQRFINEICDLLRNHSSVVVNFPQQPPLGFEDAVTSVLDNVVPLSTLDASGCPLDDLAKRYADRPSSIHRLVNLFEEQEFRGRLIIPRNLSPQKWVAWRSFLIDYTQSIRSRSSMDHSVFLVPLSGCSSDVEAVSDAGLVTIDWDSVLDDIDLLLFSSEGLRERTNDSFLRSLLAYSVAHVASWDLQTATELMGQDNATILAPHEFLRAVATNRGWSTQTPLDWRSGTCSLSGVAHPALAALDDPPKELDRRLWRAQLTVILPWIEMCRHDTVKKRIHDVKHWLRVDGESHKDPFSLENSDLCDLFSRRRHRDLQRLFRLLRDVRNKLAHCDIVTYDEILNLMGCVNQS